MSSDSFELLLNQLIKDLKIINENLELIGLFYLGKAAIKSIFYLSNSLRVFLLPKLVSNEAWIRSHGKWAIINGCTSPSGLGFSVELAKRKFNLILIDSNKIIITKIADFLAEEHKIKTVCFEPNAISRLIYDLDVLKEVGLLINCPYSHSEPGYFHLTDQNSLNEQILLNVNIPIALSRAVLPSMLSRDKGLVVFLTSSEAQLPTPYLSVQESSSSFLEKFSNSLRFEYAGKNISFQCLRIDEAFHFVEENANLDENYLKNSKNFKNIARCLRYLGWSPIMTVNWTTALRIYILNSMPGFIFNSFYSSLSKRSLSQ